MLNAMVGLHMKPRKTRLSSARLQAIRTYLVAILVLTFLLFSASLISLVNQQQAVWGLSIASLRYDGERVAQDLEVDVKQRAAVCLDTDQLKYLRYGPGDESSPEKVQAIRRVFDLQRKGNPVARYFFLWSGNKLVFPALSAQPEAVDSMVALDPSLAAQQFVALVRSAEKEESDLLGQHEKAITLYRRAAVQPVSRRLKALATYRAALAIQRARGVQASVPAFKDLVELYGREYSQSGVPYELAIATDAYDLAARIFPHYPQTLTRLRDEVITGKWELNAQQLAYTLGQLDSRLGLKPAARPHSDYLDHLALAEEASRLFRSRSAPQSGEVSLWGFSQGGRNYRMYYTLLPETQGHNLIAGFTVSASWVQEKLLPASMEEQNATKQITAIIEEVPGGDKTFENGDDLYIPVWAGSTSWRLHIPTASIQHSEAGARRELWFLAVSSGMFLCILSVGVYLLISVSRDLHWFSLRSDFVSGVSHELKTPLALIRLYSETLADGEQSYPEEERHNYIRIIARESERLSRLIDNILDFSKIEKGRKRYELQEADLAATVKQTVEDYAEYLFLRGFTVKIGIQPYLPTVKFNREQVSQMVLNLLDNARKYSDKSRLIRVHMWREDSAVVLEVQDYGFGIPVAEQQKIFEPFYRVSKGSEKGGCGLGLFLVRNVIEGHGGRIEVLSQVGKGSRFRLYFPIGEAAQQRDEEAEGVNRERWWKKAEI